MDAGENKKELIGVGLVMPETEFDKEVKKAKKSTFNDGFTDKVEKLVEVNHQIDNTYNEYIKLRSGSNEEQAERLEDIHNKKEELCELLNQKAVMCNYVDIDALFSSSPMLYQEDRNQSLHDAKIRTTDLADKTILTDKEALLFSIDENGNVGKKVAYNTLIKADLDKDGTLGRTEIDSYVDDMDKAFPNAIEVFDQKEMIRDELGIKFADKGEQIPSSYKYDIFRGTQNYEQAKDDCYYVDFNETKLLGNRFYEFIKDPETGDVSRESVEKFNKRYNLDDLDDLKQLKKDLSSGKSLGDFTIEKNNLDVPKVGGNDNNLSESDNQQKGEESSNNPIAANDDSKSNILGNNENPAQKVGDEGGKNNSAAENGIPQKDGQEIA